MEVMNVKEVARYLKCSESSIRNLVRDKKIPVFKINSKLNFNKLAIDNWIHNQEMMNLQTDNKYGTEIKPL